MSNWKYKFILRNKDNSIIPAKRIFILFLYSFFIFILLVLFFTLLLLVTLAVPAFAGRVLAEIEYFYSDDGTLIGKAFNGKRVNFEYDLRGQLLAVKDAQGKDLERYTYDPQASALNCSSSSQ